MRVIAGREEVQAVLGEGAEDHGVPRDGPRLVGYYLDETDEVHKISIVSRARRSDTRSRCPPRTAT